MTSLLRQGRSEGRNLYLVMSGDPDADVLCGQVDTAELAAWIVAATGAEAQRAQVLLAAPESGSERRSWWEQGAAAEARALREGLGRDGADAVDCLRELLRAGRSVAEAAQVLAGVFAAPEPLTVCSTGHLWVDGRCSRCEGTAITVAVAE